MCKKTRNALNSISNIRVNTRTIINDDSYFPKQTIFILSTVNYSALTYVRPLGVYEYPSWAVNLGWILAITPILFIPATAVYKAVQYRLQRKVWICIISWIKFTQILFFFLVNVGHSNSLFVLMCYTYT